MGRFRLVDTAVDIPQEPLDASVDALGIAFPLSSWKCTHPDFTGLTSLGAPVVYYVKERAYKLSKEGMMAGSLPAGIDLEGLWTGLEPGRTGRP